MKTYFIGQQLFDNEQVESATTLQCLEFCKSQPKLSIDIETTRKFPLKQFPNSNYEGGLDPYLSSVVMLQIGTDEVAYVIDTRVVSPVFLKPVLENKEILKIGHNLKFEGTHLFHNYKMELINVWDTMIVDRILYNGLPFSYSLEALAKKYLGASSTSDYDLFNYEEMYEEEYYQDELDMLEYVEKPAKIIIDKSTRLQFLTIENKPFTTAQILYGKDDIVFPFQIQKIQAEGRYISAGDHYNPIRGINMENAITQILAKIQLKGLQVDTAGWLAMYEKNMAIYRKKLAKLDAWVIKNHPKFTVIDLFDPDGRCGIDWASSKQVIALAKHMNFCPQEISKQTKRKEYTVGAKALFKLLTNENKDKFYKYDKLTEEELVMGDSQDIQGFILNYLITKKYQQLVTTFGKDWLDKYIHPITHKVHTSFMQLMNTGRLSSTSPNLQQVPNGKDWRKLFVAPKGMKMIACDFSSQEVRVLAQVSKVQDLIDFFNYGHPVYKADFHSFTASKMFSIIRNQPDLVIDKEKNSEERKVSKGLTFTLAFGGGANKIASDLGITLEKAEEFESSYLDGFAGLRQNFEETKKLALQRGWIELDPYTQKRYFYPDFADIEKTREEAFSYYPDSYKDMTKEERKLFKDNLYIEKPYVKDLWKKWGQLKGTLERRSLNFRIQGNAATCSKLAMYLLERDNKNPDEGLVLFVHDEAILIYPEKFAELKAVEVKDLMILSAKYTLPDVKMDADYAIGDYWIH